MHVYTTSGTHVGRVADFSIDSDSGMVLEYLVRKGFVSTVTIARDRVVRIEEEKLIVEDRVLTDFEEVKKKISLNPPNPVGLMEDETP